MLELEQKLGLYQVFLNLYENDRGLLEEILQLENASDRALTRSRGKYKYIMGVVEEKRAYLIANLLDSQSQKIFQPQNIWTIGRGKKAGISLADDRLSRNHAAIEYVGDRGFYIQDLNSTNGTYVNQEPIGSDRLLLQEGDRVRLGSLVFYFSSCLESRQLANIPKNVASLLNKNKPLAFSPELAEPLEQKTHFFLSEEERTQSENLLEIDSNRQSDILDRFFNQQHHQF
ncbi:MAG: FHA domain-containing protein [Cyanobacteria bacterium SBLK]|nr:FHA domain-containing protein [Cyanobacteria bacterium SBLK]